jgi:hypothetical protein
MEDLLNRGARTFKFLDRTFNLNIERAQGIMEFFLKKIDGHSPANQGAGFTLHFEMVPSRFPPPLRETLSRFPPNSLRLEIGIQTLMPEVSERIGRSSNPEEELELIRFLREKTNAIIHADLIAGLPGEDLASFGRGFDRLWAALSGTVEAPAEIQLGILKLLPGAPIARHTEAFGMRYSPEPPYEVLETGALCARDLDRIKNFARFWELIVNRGLFSGHKERADRLLPPGRPVFERFMGVSEQLLAHFGRNWGIDKQKLQEAAAEFSP